MIDNLRDAFLMGWRPLLKEMVERVCEGRSRVNVKKC